ncbi:MAG TPA: FAD-dependent oxidoreductase, partial [Terriglobales bacterium]|nr:FAD-dependent oxidoreductase [Terriglobales bacterium]
MKTRAASLRALESDSYDVCVIGAGATGAGCALDAQLRGLRTALVDTGDFASGTSSASTKLAHGGIRYLQQAVAELDPGQLKVVREALVERKRMLQNAPHLAQARQFLVPCFSRFEMLYYAIGLKLYDWLAGAARLGVSRVLTRSEALTDLPTLTRGGTSGAVTYEDGQFDDARFCVTLVKSFSDAGGEVANYLKVVGFERGEGGRLTGAVVEDAFTLRTFEVRAKAFVNATGPLSDELRSVTNAGTPGRLILSKGVHILLPLVGEVTTALLIPKTEDGRVIFAIPWLGRLLVGTTDEEVAPGQDVDVMKEEVEYLLRHLNRYSTLQYAANDVVSAFSGVRPLVRAAHSRQTKKLIRAHEVEADRTSGLISILGGKWTTYRAMAQDTIDAVQKQLGNSVPCKTYDFRLAGAEGYGADQWRLLANIYGLSETTARHLAEKFGTEAEAVLSLTKEDSRLSSPLVRDAAPIQAEVVYCARKEMATTIEDVLARRLGLQYFSWKLAMQAAPVVAELMAGDWDRPCRAGPWS